MARLKRQNWFLFILFWMPLLAYSQCVTNIAGTGIGAGFVCTAPNSYTYIQATYSSTVTQPGWSYTWTISTNGSITYGQGTSTIQAWWSAAPSGNCASWVNLEVSDGQGCVYNYGLANSVLGKCVEVRTRPSPEFEGPGHAGISQWACIWEPPLNNGNTYTVNSPISGCTYNWAITGGSIVSGQGTSSMQAIWPTNVPNTTSLDLSVISPNGCNSSYSAEFSPSSTGIVVGQGPYVGPVVGPTTALPNSCVCRYTGSWISSIQGGWGAWSVTGGTVVSQLLDPNCCYGMHNDTIDIIWDSLASVHRVMLQSSSITLQCASAEAIDVNVLPDSVQFHRILGDTLVCDNGLSSYAIASRPGAAYQWTVINGTILSGQGTSTIDVNWGNLGVGYVELKTILGPCEAKDSLAVNVVAAPTVSLGADTISCGYAILLSSGVNALSYLWSTGATTATLMAGVDGAYWLQIVDSNHCEGNDTIQVTLNHVVDVDLGQDTVVCPPTYTLWPLTSLGTFQWSNGSTSDSLVVNSSGTYALIVTDTNNCSSIDSIAIQFAEPQATIFPPGPIDFCIGGSVMLLGPNDYSSYIWNGFPGGQTVIMSQMGPVYLTVIDSIGCTATSQPCILNAHSPPNAMISIVGDTLFAAPFGTYNWLLNGQATGQTGPWIIPSIPGSYAVEVTDTFGCVDESQPVSIVVDLMPDRPQVASIWPNPTESDFHLSLRAAWHGLPIKLTMLDLQGKTVQPELESEGESFLVRTKGIPAGLYLVQLTAGEDLLTFKVVLRER